MSHKGKVMKTEWKNTEPFKRHIEEMASFRRTHPRLTPLEPDNADRGIPDPQSITPYQADSAKFLTDEKGDIIVFPLWDIALPRDSQN